MRMFVSIRYLELLSLVSAGHGLSCRLFPLEASERVLVVLRLVIFEFRVHLVVLIARVVVRFHAPAGFLPLMGRLCHVSLAPLSTLTTSLLPGFSRDSVPSYFGSAEAAAHRGYARHWQ